VLSVLAFAADDPNPTDALTNVNAATQMAARRSATILDFMVQLSNARNTLYGAQGREPYRKVDKFNMNANSAAVNPAWIRVSAKRKSWYR
jgi:hypothetical protein